MQQHSIDHPNARTCWETMALREGNTKTALIVETDLIYDPDKDGYDVNAFQSLKDAAQEYVTMQTHIDVIVFYTIGDLHAQRPKGKKRFADLIGNAVPVDGNNKAAHGVARTGGTARDKSISAKRRKEIAKKAASARWEG